MHGATHLSECAWLRRYRSPQRACVATFSVANSSVWKTPGNADAPSEVTSGAKGDDRVSGGEVLRLESARYMCSIGRMRTRRAAGSTVGMGGLTWQVDVAGQGGGAQMISDDEPIEMGPRPANHTCRAGPRKRRARVCNSRQHNIWEPGRCNGFYLFGHWQTLGCAVRIGVAGHRTCISSSCRQRRF